MSVSTWKVSLNVLGFLIADDGTPAIGPDPSGGPFTGMDVDAIAGVSAINGLPVYDANAILANGAASQPGSAGPESYQAERARSSATDLPQVKLLPAQRTGNEQVPLNDEDNGAVKTEQFVNRREWILAATAASLSGSVSAEVMPDVPPIRTWKSDTGSEARARFVRLSGTLANRQVLIELEGGKGQREVPFRRLSDIDREYVAKLTIPKVIPVETVLLNLNSSPEALSLPIRGPADKFALQVNQVACGDCVVKFDARNPPVSPGFEAKPIVFELTKGAWASRGGGFFEMPIWLQDIPIVLTISAHLKWAKEALKVEFDPWLTISHNKRKGTREDFAAEQLNEKLQSVRKTAQKQQAILEAAPRTLTKIDKQLDFLRSQLVPIDHPSAQGINGPIGNEIDALQRQRNKVLNAYQRAPATLKDLEARFARLTDVLNLVHAYANKIEIEYEVYSKAGGLVQLVIASAPLAIAPPRSLLREHLQKLVRELSDV